MKLFTPIQIGPMQIRNRFIRAAAFEGMCKGHQVTPALIQYHTEVAKGMVGMTTVAYASVSKSGLSFPHQLLFEETQKEGLITLVESVKREGAAISVQLGHCGNMAKYRTIQQRAYAPSAIPNLYAMTWPKAMTKQDIRNLRADFKKAVHLAISCGFDAVEIHAGHGYLLSQFLSPYTNKRTDFYGGNLQNRMRLMKEIFEDIIDLSQQKIAILAKVNMSDGFVGGITRTDALAAMQELELLGVHALVLSGGFVSKSPMYVMRGTMPFHTLAKHTDEKYLRQFIRWFGSLLVPSETYKPLYFLEDARFFREHIKNTKLIYVGGVVSKNDAALLMDEGFDGIAVARALIEDPYWIRKMMNNTKTNSACDACNECIAQIYNSAFSCVKHSSNED